MGRGQPSHPLHTRTGLREHTFRDFEHGTWEDDGGLLSPLLSMFQTPKVEPFALLTWAVTTTRRKSKKKSDLWEGNYHSGPVEKAGEILIPPPQGASTLRLNAPK